MTEYFTQGDIVATSIDDRNHLLLDVSAGGVTIRLDIGPGEKSKSIARDLDIINEDSERPRFTQGYTLANGPVVLALPNEEIREEKLKDLYGGPHGGLYGKLDKEQEAEDWV